MIVCDKCGEKSELKTYSVPIIEDIQYDLHGGRGKSVLMRYTHSERRDRDIQLCPKCSTELGIIINVYLSQGNK